MEHSEMEAGQVEEELHAMPAVHTGPRPGPNAPPSTGMPCLITEASNIDQPSFMTLMMTVNESVIEIHIWGTKLVII